MSIKKTYAFHTPSAESLVKITTIREAFTRLDETIRQLSPVSREQACALTNLETAAMWAVKAVVSNDPESKADVVR